MSFRILEALFSVIFLTSFLEDALLVNLFLDAPRRFLSLEDALRPIASVVSFPTVYADWKLKGLMCGHGSLTPLAVRMHLDLVAFLDEDSG